MNLVTGRMNSFVVKVRLSVAFMNGDKCVHRSMFRSNNSSSALVSHLRQYALDEMAHGLFPPRVFKLSDNLESAGQRFFSCFYRQRFNATFISAIGLILSHKSRDLVRLRGCEEIVDISGSQVCCPRRRMAFVVGVLGLLEGLHLMICITTHAGVCKSGSKRVVCAAQIAFRVVRQRR